MQNNSHPAGATFILVTAIFIALFCFIGIFSEVTLKAVRKSVKGDTVTVSRPDTLLILKINQ